MGPSDQCEADTWLPSLFSKGDTGLRGVGQESRAMASRVMARVPSPTGGVSVSRPGCSHDTAHDDSMMIQ